MAQDEIDTTTQEQEQVPNQAQGQVPDLAQEDVQERVYENVEQAEERVERAEERIEQAEERIDEAEERVERAEERVESAEERVDAGIDQEVLDALDSSDDASEQDSDDVAARAQAMDVKEAQDMLNRIVQNVEKVIVGKREPVELVVMSLVAGGHVLLEDMPGTGKTSLVSALAKSIDCSFRRIQFTPDVMPSDVTGFSIFNQKTREFEFRPGSVMANIVLADEINRASAKTQSAMLEAMEERQVTVDGVTRKLEEPFMVLATQNPIEQYGTYPLPEAQLDRFLIKLSLGYLKTDEEVKAVLHADDAKETLSPVATGDDIMALRATSKAVKVADSVARYAVQIGSGTRENPECAFGSSPRGPKSLIQLGRAHALMRGRTYVTPEDIKYLAPYALCHRIGLSHEAKMEGRTAADVVATVLETVAVPELSRDEAESL